MAVAELRPSLEAVLMVADQPLDEPTLASAVGTPSTTCPRALARAGRRVHRAGPRLRAAQRRRRLAVLHPRGVRRRGRGVRPRRAAGPADPGGAGDAGRGGLQAAGVAGPGVRDPWRERRRRDAHPADPRAWSRRSGQDERVRREPLPHHQLLPRADRRSARSTSCPSSRRTCPTWTTWRTSWRRWPGPARRTWPTVGASDGSGEHRRARGVDSSSTTTAWSGCRSARPVGGGLAPQVRGADARRAGRGRRRGRHPARHQGRPAHRRGPRRRQAAAADLAERLPRAQQAARRGLHDVRPGGPADPAGPRGRPARAAVPRRPARHRHVRPDPAHQRRRLRAADGAPVVRGGQDVRRRGRGRGHQGDPPAAARRGRARRRPGDGVAGEDRQPRPGQDASSSWSSTRAATGSCAGCSTTSGTPYAG